jgi:AcrR family transcriptional regulator
VPGKKTEPTVALSRGHKKRSRTRVQLLDAATRMYSRGDSSEVSLAGLAEEANLANGTVYNYFRTREEVREATGVDLADRFSDKVAAAYAKLDNGAQRVAIGMRWFVRHAEEDPIWGRAVSRISGTAKAMKSILANYIRTDLRLGKRQGHFTYDDENVALDLCLATVLAAVRASTEGPFIIDHPEKCAEMVLRALGVSHGQSKRFAHMALPNLNAPADDPKTGIARRKRALLAPKTRA